MLRSSLVPTTHTRSCWRGCEILYTILKSGPQTITEVEVAQIQAAIADAKGEPWPPK